MSDLENFVLSCEIHTDMDSNNTGWVTAMIEGVEVNPNISVEVIEDDWNEYYLEGADHNWQLWLGDKTAVKELCYELASTLDEHKEPFPEIHDEVEADD